MDIREDKDRETQEDVSAAQPMPSKRDGLPCGNQLCLRCHEECEVVMASYLGLEEKEFSEGNL
jgi:hypothetical protein